MKWIKEYNYAKANILNCKIEISMPKKMPGTKILSNTTKNGNSA